MIFNLGFTLNPAGAASRTSVEEADEAALSRRSLHDVGTMKNEFSQKTHTYVRVGNVKD